MKKNVLRWLIAFAVVLPCLLVSASAAVASGYCGSMYNGNSLYDVTWTFYEDGELVIEGNGVMSAYDASRVPWASYESQVKKVTIRDSVKNVGSYAFQNCSNLISVTIGSGATKVGTSAFKNCDALTEVIISNGVSEIGDDAFNDCDALSEAVIPDTVTKIGQRAFYTCNALKAVTIGDGVTTIGVNAFAYCYELESVTIGHSVKNIEQNAFLSCDSLSSVTFPATVTTIGSGAFQWCDDLAVVTFLGNVPQSVLNNAFASCSRDLAVHYHEGTTGWPETGVWQDVPLVMDPHTVIADEAVAATCGKTGLTEGSHCSVCDKVLVAQEVVPATGVHGYQVDEAVEATCTADGLTTGVSCPNCDFVYVAQEVVPATGHTEVTSEAVEPCCSATGLTAGSYCSTCGETLSGREVLPKTSHTYVVDTPQDPTCTEVGYSGTGMHCGVCGEVLLAQTEIPALGHDTVQHEAQAPTYESVGWEAYESCTRCDYTTYVELPKLEVTAYAITVGGATNGTIVVDKISAAAGETVTITATPASNYALHEIYVDGAAIEGNTFTVTGAHTVTAEFVKVATFYGANVDMGNKLAMNIVVLQSYFTGKTGLYAEVIGPDPESTVPGVTRTVRVEQKDWVKNGSYFMFTYDGIAAKQMGDKITVTIYNARGNAISEVYEDSMSEYIERKLEGQGKEGKALFVDMLNYGAAAQTKFGYDTENLANSWLTDAQKAYGTDEMAACTNNLVQGANYKGTSLVLTSRISMQIAFMNVKTLNLYAKVSFTDHMGEKVDVRIENADIAVNGNYRVVKVEQIVVADGRMPVTCEVYNADTGELVASCVDSMESYIARQATGANEWMKAIMIFSDSAHAYIHRND